MQYRNPNCSCGRLAQKSAPTSHTCAPRQRHIRCSLVRRLYLAAVRFPAALPTHPPSNQLIRTWLGFGSGLVTRTLTLTLAPALTLGQRTWSDISSSGTACLHMPSSSCTCDASQGVLCCCVAVLRGDGAGRRSAARRAL